MYSSSESAASVSFNMLHKSCGTRLKQQYICPKDNVVVEKDEIAKGYEFAKGQYVLFSPEEIKALDEKATNTIDIAEFVPLAKVDRIYLEKAYYLGPDKGGERAYRLLLEALKATGRAAVGQYSARGKQNLVLVRPLEGVLVMEQLHYADELRPVTEVPIPDTQVKDAELQLAKQLIEQSATDEFKPSPVSRHGERPGPGGDSGQGGRPGDRGRRAPGPGDQDHRPDGGAEGEPLQVGQGPAGKAPAMKVVKGGKEKRVKKAARG